LTSSKRCQARVTVTTRGLRVTGNLLVECIGYGVAVFVVVVEVSHLSATSYQSYIGSIEGEHITDRRRIGVEIALPQTSNGLVSIRPFELDAVILVQAQLEQRLRRA